MHGQCDARPAVTFPAAGHHRLLTSTKLYCLVIEAHVWRTCPRLIPEITRIGVRSTTYEAQVQSPNKCAIRPAIITFIRDWMFYFMPGIYLCDCKLVMYMFIFFLFLHPGSGGKVLWWLCVCVCLSTSVSLELYIQSSHNFLCMLLMDVARSSSASVAIHYIFLVFCMTSY